MRKLRTLLATYRDAGGDHPSCCCTMPTTAVP